MCAKRATGKGRHSFVFNSWPQGTEKIVLFTALLPDKHDMGGKLAGAARPK
jgi:hypothetical protein